MLKRSQAKMKKKVTTIEFTKTNIILAAVSVILLCYILIIGKSSTPINDLKYKTDIDSLNKAISNFQQHQVLLNEKISNKELAIKKLNREIDSTKQIVIKQRKNYGDKIKNAGRYTPTELDSFFSSRYK